MLAHRLWCFRLLPNHFQASLLLRPEMTAAAWRRLKWSYHCLYLSTRAAHLQCLCPYYHRQSGLPFRQSHYSSVTGKGSIEDLGPNACLTRLVTTLQIASGGIPPSLPHSARVNQGSCRSNARHITSIFARCRLPSRELCTASGEMISWSCNSPSDSS
jgi:hypothetical protein